MDECIEAGIKDIILIISKKKSIIKNYFYRDNFYKRIIKKKKDKRILKEYRKIQKYKKKIKFIYQNEPRGTGDAVLKTKNLIADTGEMNLLKANNVEIKSLEVDYGIYDKLLPENCNSQIGNKHNRTKLYGSTIDTDNLESINGKIQNF